MVWHDGLAGFKIDRAVDIQTVPPTTLLYRKGHLFGRPAANRPDRVGGMHRVGEDHRFIGEDPVHQSVVFLDKRRLLRRVELAGDRGGLAMFHAQTMQQRDQPRPGLVGNAVFARDPRPHLMRRARQRRGDPGFQGLLLRHCGMSAGLSGILCEGS